MLEFPNDDDDFLLPDDEPSIPVAKVKAKVKKPEKKVKEAETDGVEMALYSQIVYKISDIEKELTSLKTLLARQVEEQESKQESTEVDPVEMIVNLQTQNSLILQHLHHIVVENLKLQKKVDTLQPKTKRWFLF